MSGDVLSLLGPSVSCVGRRMTSQQHHNEALERVDPPRGGERGYAQEPRVDVASQVMVVGQDRTYATEIWNPTCPSKMIHQGVASLNELYYVVYHGPRHLRRDLDTASVSGVVSWATTDAGARECPSPSTCWKRTEGCSKTPRTLARG